MKKYILILIVSVVWSLPVSAQSSHNEANTEEIIESGVKKVAIACPFCMVMIQDGLNKTGHDKDIQVVDLAELVQKAMK